MTNSQRLAQVRDFFARWLSAQTESATSQPDDSEDKVPEETQSGDVPIRGRLDEVGHESESEKAIRNESILIRDGFYCGRRFQAAQHHAIWFMEEDQLKIHDTDGSVVAVFSGEELSDTSIFDTSVPESDVPESDVPEERTEDLSVVSIDTPIDDKPEDGETTKKAA